MRYVTFFFSLYYVFEIQYALSHQLVQQISIWTSHIASAQNHMWLAATILDSTAVGGSTLLLFWLQPSSWGQGICEAKGTYVPRSPHLLLDYSPDIWDFQLPYPKGPQSTSRICTDPFSGSITGVQKGPPFWGWTMLLLCALLDLRRSKEMPACGRDRNRAWTSGLRFLCRTELGPGREDGQVRYQPREPGHPSPHHHMPGENSEVSKNSTLEL